MSEIDDHEVELEEFMASIPKPQTQAELAAELKAEQASLTRAEVARRAAAGTLPIGKDEEGSTVYASKAEGVFDPETAVAPEHKWIDRGLVMSCEGAGHANHRHVKQTARR